MAETCDRCHRALTEDETAKGWPIAAPSEDGDPTQDFEDVCPSCYGDEAFCPEGHVLHGHSDSSQCDECDRKTETQRWEAGIWEQIGGFVAWSSHKNESLALAAARRYARQRRAPTGGALSWSGGVCAPDGSVVWYDAAGQIQHLALGR